MAKTIGSRAVATGRGGADVASGTSDAMVSQREDLSNFISMITRDETPFLASIGKSKATAIRHEWQTDALAAPADSRIAEGVDYADAGTSASSNEFPAGFTTVGGHRTRLSNVCQINGKTITVSGTRRAIDQAGVADEYAYQLKKRGTEMRRDVESDLVNTANVAVTGTNIRSMGTLRSWLSAGASTVQRNGVAAVAGGDQGEGSTVPAGSNLEHAGSSVTDVSLSLADIDAVMQSIYEEGGDASRVMLSPKLRRDFSDLMVSDTGVRRNMDADGKLRQSVDVYMSDFGDLMVVPNYIMGLGTLANEAAFIYDPQWWAIATLRPMQEVEVGQKGDSTVGMFVEECTLECKNPLGSGAIYGLA